MKITFLGTGGVCGVPEWNCNCKVCKSKNPKDKRLRSCILVQIGNKNIAVDFGPDFRQQLMKYGIKKLDYAFLTHAHGDHTYGYAELSRQKNLILEAPKEVLEEFFIRMGRTKKWLAARNPSLKARPFQTKKIGGVEIQTVALIHQKDYEKDYLPCYGYLFRTKKSSFAYLCDFNEIIEEKKVRGVDILVSDGASFMNSKQGHIGIKDSVKLFGKLKPKRMLLTHINHTTGHEFISEYVKKFGNIKPAYDGLEIKLK